MPRAEVVPPVRAEAERRAAGFFAAVERLAVVERDAAGFAADERDAAGFAADERDAAGLRAVEAAGLAADARDAAGLRAAGLRARACGPSSGSRSRSTRWAGHRSSARARRRAW